MTGYTTMETITFYWGSLLTAICGLLYTFAITALGGNPSAGYFIFGMFAAIGIIGIFLYQRKLSKH